MLVATTFMLLSAVAQSASPGGASLEGTVVEAPGSTPIPGASVRAGDTATTTDYRGGFALQSLAVGNSVLTVSAPGFRRIERPIELRLGQNKLAAVPLEADVATLSDLTVTAPDSPAQSKFDDRAGSEGLTEVLSETTLKNANAQNSSDFVKDVSGVAVSKGANGSSSVSIRGIDQRMLRITVDGQRQGGSGNPLDSIPAEIVQSLEVTKSFTPDMEADAVGGVININTGGTVIKDAYVQGRHQIVQNTLAPQPGSRNSLTIGQPFALFSGDRNASVLATASFDDQRATRERVSTLREWTPQVSPGPAPYLDEEIPVLTQPLIESTLEHRQRTGLVLNSDARFDTGSLFWRSNFGREWASRHRDYNDTNPAAGTAQALTPVSGVFSGVPLSRRNQDQIASREALNVSFGGKSRVGGAEIDGTVAYALTDEDEPHTLETGFLSDHAYRVSYDFAQNPYEPHYSQVDESDPADITSANDPAHYRLDYLSITRSEIHEHDASAKLDAKFNLLNGADYLKFGVKAQRRRRTADTDRELFDAADPALDMTGLVGTPRVTMDTVGYRFGPVPSASAVAALYGTTPGLFANNVAQTLINSNTGDYSVTETLWAAYGMGKVRLGEWTLLGGVRIEGTRVYSTGNQMQLDASGQLQGFATAHARNDYVEILPGMHLRYEPAAGLLYRASITRSMSRPTNADIAPYRTLSFVDHRSRIGAPDLKPYLSTNFDVSVDKYDDAFGLVSFAIFYKKIDHFITDAQYPVTIGNLGEFIEFKRVNGAAARGMGFELSWQGPSWSLPVELGRASVEVNYSFNHGEAHHPTRPGETFPLPRQVDHQGSLKLHDERGPMSIDASVSYRTGWWEDLIAPGLDNYITSAWDAEISAAYRIGKNSRFTAGINNVLDRPTRHYAGTPSRMNDWQRNGIEMNLGVQWKL
jgi:TonB-dependent receptor